MLEEEEDDIPRLDLGEGIFARPALRPAAAGEIWPGMGRQFST